MSNTELKSVGDMCKEIKDLKARIDYCEGIMEEDEDLKERHKSDMSDLKEENKKLQEAVPWLRIVHKHLGDPPEVIRLKEENEKLKEELANRVYDKQGAKDCFDLVDQEDLDEANEEKSVFEQNYHDEEMKAEGYWDQMVDLRAENEKRFDEIEKLKLELQKKPEAGGDFQCGQLIEENQSLVKFIAGNTNEQDAVEKIIKKTYSSEFIKGNQETWNDFGLFED